MFWFGIAATALWLVLIVGMAATRSSEWWPLFGAGDNRLALNAVGDTLAGVFAPLAFLWLFVATWLQRRELQLQREELSQTRDVLASQMKELERSADESRHQTEIMQKTLEAARSRETYEIFSLRLYYPASYALSMKERSVYYLAEYRAFREEILVPSANLSVLENNTVDNFFKELLTSIQSFNSLFELVLYGNETETKALKETAFVLNLIDEELDLLLKDPAFEENSLVRERIRGVELKILSGHLKKSLDWLSRLPLVGA